MPWDFFIIGKTIFTVSFPGYVVFPESSSVMILCISTGRWCGMLLSVTVLLPLLWQELVAFLSQPVYIFGIHFLTRLVGSETIVDMVM